jgi:hypothetical protein
LGKIETPFEPNEQFTSAILTTSKDVTTETWIQAVIYEHQGTLALCDKYLIQTKPASSISSRTSSKRSSISSAQDKIREDERKEQEALLRLQQSEDAVRRQAAEDATLRELRDKERQIQADRDLCKLKDEVEVQKLSGAIMRQ